MPWCPKCKSEYRSGFFECKECGSELVEYLEAEQPESEIARQFGAPRDLGPACFLMSVADEREATLVNSVLEGEGIPTLLKHKDLGSYLNISTGGSYFGIDIFVPESLLEKGKELIDGMEMLGIGSQSSDLPKNSVSISKRLIVGLFVMFILVSLAVWTVSILNN